MNSDILQFPSRSASENTRIGRVTSRLFVRYTLELPFTFSWRGSGTRHRGAGKTRDISAGGIYVTSRQCPALDAEVRFELSVLTTSLTNNRLNMTSVGRVVRVETDAIGICKGFAIRSGRFVMSRRTDSQTAL